VRLQCYLGATKLRRYEQQDRSLARGGLFPLCSEAVYAAGLMTGSANTASFYDAAPGPGPDVRRKHFTKISAQPFGMAAEVVPAEAGGRGSSVETP